MKKMFLPIFILALLPLNAMAETRSIAIEIYHSIDNNVELAMYSDVENENRKNLSIEEAIEILQNATGWGSIVYVAIIVDGTEINEYISVIQTIAENPWLSLSLLKEKRGHGYHILEYYGMEQGNPAD